MFGHSFGWAKNESQPAAKYYQNTDRGQIQRSNKLSKNVNGVQKRLKT